MTFSIIGTGNVGWFFGKRLAAAGHQCKGVYGRNRSSVKELADALLSNKYGSINEARDEDADVCFIAVTDAALEEVAAQLSFKETVLIHMAGALPLDIIKKAAKDRAVLWPIYSITKHNTIADRNIPCAWDTSSDRAKRFALEMGHAITDNLFEAKDEQRRWLHLSAVMTNNFINHLLSISELICTENKLPAKALQPLITQTFDRLKSASPLTTQTGPAIRHDTTTIELQKALLLQHPHLLKVYEALTESIQEVHKPK